MHTIVLASRNRKKSQEVYELLAPHGFKVVPVTEFADLPEVEEDGQTFAENAAKKAREVVEERQRRAALPREVLQPYGHADLHHQRRWHSR